MSTFYDDQRTFDAYPRGRPSPTPFSDRFHPVVQKHLARVYTLLTLALSLAAVGAILTVQAYAKRVFWPATLASFLQLPLVFAVYSSPQHSPWRARFFYVLSFFEGMAAAPLISLVAVVNPRIPVLAFMAAAAVFLCCTMSAMLARRRSYLFLGSFCFTGLSILVFHGLIQSFFRPLVPFSAILYFGLFIFCGFVLFDTQVIIEKANEGDRDHVAHALDLLIDFIAIFKRLAVIMASNQRRSNDDDNENRRNSRRSS